MVTQAAIKLMPVGTVAVWAQVAPPSVVRKIALPSVAYRVLGSLAEIVKPFTGSGKTCSIPAGDQVAPMSVLLKTPPNAVAAYREPSELATKSTKGGKKGSAVQ